MSEEVEKELMFVVPIIANNQKIFDRLTIANELKLGMSLY